ncbi:MAG: CHAT domain-containing protein [Thermoanaerobaculia bacterium]|nr:CHAT domain-containing protein [Thermoanaerobaculia bacterium]
MISHRVSSLLVVLAVSSSCGPRLARDEVLPPDPGSAESPVSSVFIQELAAGSALSAAGIEAGDGVLDYRLGELVETVDTVDDLWLAEFEVAPRGDFALRIVRGGEEFEYEVGPGRWEVEARPAFSSRLFNNLEAGRFQPEVVGRLNPSVAAWAWAQWAVRADDNENSAGGEIPDASFGPTLDLVQTEGDDELEGWLRIQRTRWLAKRGRGDEALEEGARAVQIFDALAMPLAKAQALIAQGWAAGRSGQPSEEERFYRQAVETIESETPSSLHLVKAWSGLAKARASQGDYKTASGLAQRAIELSSDRDPRGLDHQASLILSGIFAWFQSDWIVAESALFEALEILREIDPEHQDVANALNNLGIVAVARGDLGAGERYYQDSLATRRRVAPDPLEESRTLNNLGAIARARGDLEAESRLNAEVLEIRRRLSPDSLDLASPLLNQGELLTLLGRFEESEAMLDEAIELQRRYAPESADEIMGLAALAELAVRRGDREQAHRTYREAEALAARTQPDTLLAARVACRAARLREESEATNDSLRDLQLAARRLQRLVPGTLDTALALHALGRAQSRRGLEAAALGSLEAAVRSMDRQFMTLGGGEEQRAGFRQSWRDVYRDLAEQYRRMGRPEAAFETLDRSRGQVFLEILQRREIDVAERLEADGARWAGLTSVRPVDELQRALRRSRLALVLYTVADSTSRAWILDGETLTSVELPMGSAQLADRIERFRLLIERPPPVSAVGPLHLSRELYDALWDPLTAALGNHGRVVVVPDGPLHELAFSALTRSDGTPLGSNITLQFAGSPTVWLELAERSPPTRPDTLVAFADPPAAATDSTVRRGASALRSLPASRLEAQGLERLYRRATVLLGSSATEEAARALAIDTGVLHFATHALIDPRSPLDSALVLAPSIDHHGRRYDGLLQAWEVLQELDLEASLVTLSACSSGTGQVYLDEGVLGLTRAFQIAGAQTVLASLWPVEDSATARLMEEFYRRARAGASYDEALGKAQRSLRREAATTHPYYWAGFQLYGAPALSKHPR